MKSYKYQSGDMRTWYDTHIHRDFSKPRKVNQSDFWKCDGSGEKISLDTHNPTSLTYATICEQKCHDSIRTRGWRGTETFNIKYQTFRILKLRTDPEKRGENIDTATKFVPHVTSFPLSSDYQPCACEYSRSPRVMLISRFSLDFRNYRTMCMLREKY